jgi:hypothetical protein
MRTSVLSLLLASVLLCSGAGIEQSNRTSEHENGPKLEGIWTFRASFPGQAMPVYVGTAHFRADGTFSGPAIDQHSGPTTGEWIEVGHLQYAFTFLADTFDSSGNFANTHRVRGMLRLTHDGSIASGQTILEIIDTTGAVIFTSPVPTPFTGTRTVVQPF